MRLDEVGYWSEVKLDIIQKYAQAYSSIMAAQMNPSFHHVYVDAFAGAGVHVSRDTRELVPGSPLNALSVDPPFAEYYFIDIKADKVRALEAIAGQRDDVSIFQGDCNDILLQHVFPRIGYADYRRGLCVLDPYGLHLDWRVILEAGRARSIEIFLNFPIVDMNRNVLWHHPEGVDPDQEARMERFWGDDSWREAAYARTPTLFGDEETKRDNDAVASAFGERLRKMAGFRYVPAPMPMCNSRGAVIYYLFFASPKAVAADIVDEIFDKYGQRAR